jgi:Bacterial archaeo-eukaryotic release factor family 3
MNLHDIHELQQIHAYPCLTITLPTHRTWPDNRADPIRVKNLVTEATNRLLGEFSKRDVTPLLERLDALVADIDYKYTLDGLVLTVNQEMAREFVLPFDLAERVVVDETFFTRDLVHALNRTHRYWVLSLSEQPTRLFSATREHLEEVAGGFPMQHAGPGGEAPLPGGPGVNRSRHRDDRHRQFFRAVDQALGPHLIEDPLPLALAGIDRYQSFFREVSSRADGIIATLPGSYDHMAAHHLGRLVWPPVREGFSARRREALQQLGAAAGRHRSVSTLGEVWRLANEGRADVLLVEESYHEPARINEIGLLDLQVDDPAAPGVLDDAVDEVITTVLGKGGRVVFADDGELAQHGRIALILRY